MDNAIRDKCILQILTNQRVILSQTKTDEGETTRKVTAAVLDEAAINNDRGIV